MKKIFFYTAMLGIMISCEKNPEAELDQAQETVTKIYLQEQKMSAGKVSQQEHRRQVDSLYKELERLNENLNEEEREQLEAFARERFLKLFPKNASAE